MDPILALPPTLPPHDAAPFSPVPAEIVATWPVGTFVENLAVLDDGSIAVSVLTEARIDRVMPDGTVEILRQFSAPPTGLAVVNGQLYAGVGEPGVAPMTLWRIDPATDDAEAVMDIADMVFLNGLTPLSRGKLLAADSHLGALIWIDLASRTSGIWFTHELLTRAPGIDFLPGANGIKRFGDHIYVSSNGRALLTRIGIAPDDSAAEFEIVAHRVRVDDLAFDAAGNAYLTTHISHGVDRLSPAGERTTIGGPDQGLAGSTACAFGRRPVDRMQLYVTTTGGIVTPPGGVLQEAKLVRLDVGVPGAPLGEAA